MRRARLLLLPLALAIAPDGTWLALANVPDRHQDLWIMRPDGSGLSRLTDDEARDWNPQFTPDGTAVTFFSNVTGKYEGWSIKLDGSGRTQLTDFSQLVTFVMLGQDGKRLMAGLTRGGVFGDPPWPVTDSTADVIPGLAVGDGTVTPTYWTGDGRWLSGYVVDSAGEATGQAVYDLSTGRARRLNRDSRGYSVGWLPGYRRVVYFTNQGGLVMQDIETLERREVLRTLPWPPDQLGTIVAAPDGRTIYYGARQVESNIWLVKNSKAVSKSR